jgi:CRISPR/Cas system-associated exonuclease Cas4 (RecB family)
MRPIPVSWISTYLYCKRKLYLEQIKNLKTSDKKFLLKIEIKHKIFDKINSKDEEIVKSIKSFKKLDEIQMIYRKKYYEIVNGIIEEEYVRLSNEGFSGTDFFHEIWPNVLREAEFRASSVFNFMVRDKIYSNELWTGLFPKYLSEVKLEDNTLIGTIDRIEIYPEHVVPIEIKTSSGPKEGVWPGDRIQVESYMLLVEKEFGKKVKHGFVNYLESEEKRPVLNNEFIREYISTLLDSMDKCLQGKLPDFVKNRNKCIKCPLKEECYRIKN